MTRPKTLHFCFAFLLANATIPATASAVDQQQSLDLLVRTLQTTQSPDIRASLMRGMLSALEGQRDVQPPQGWTTLHSQLATSDSAAVRDLSRELSQIFGDQAATQKALSRLKDKSVDANERLKILNSLLMQQNKEASALLESLLDEPVLMISAIRGYAAVDNPAAPDVLLGRFATMSGDQRRAVIETLATRKNYAQKLLAALKDKTVAKGDVPAQVARSLQMLLGEPFTQVFGEVRQVAGNREKLIAKYKKMVTPESLAKADASRGRAIFQKTCAACHILYGEGGKVGPDLTGSNRANLDYLLLNSVDPSYDVPEGYKMVSIVTVDGRVINGVVGEEDGNRVVLKTAEQPRVVVAKADIERRSISPKSIMPDGQLDQMKPREVVDLIKYLRTTEQVELVK